MNRLTLQDPTSLSATGCLQISISCDPDARLRYSIDYWEECIMKWRIPTVAAFAVFLGFSLGNDSGQTSQVRDLGGWLGIGFSKAQARGRAHARRGVRRTARRTTRRVVRRRTTIAGCSR